MSRTGKIVSVCCGAPLKWVKRLPSTGIFEKIAEKPVRVGRKLGARVHTYICTKCGKADRPVASRETAKAIASGDAKKAQATA